MTTPPTPTPYEFQSDGLRLLALVARSDPDHAAAAAPAGGFVPWIAAVYGIPSRARLAGAVLAAMRATDGMDGPALWAVELAVEAGDWDGAARVCEQILEIDHGSEPFAAELHRRLVEAGRGGAVRRG